MTTPVRIPPMNLRLSPRLRIMIFGAVAFVVIGVTVYFSQRADSAYEAMGLGQYSRAFDLYLNDARDGDGNAQNSIGNMYYLGMGVDRDYDSANLWYREAASTGHAAAQLNLGHLYKQGLGVIQDPVRAFGWYRMAHIHGSPIAEYYLTQISLEYTLSPLMIETATNRWQKLSEILNEEP